jgi:hypothetical protein
MNWNKYILNAAVKNHEVYCAANGIEVEKKPINRYAIYNVFMEELDEKGTFDTVEEAKEFISEHELPRDNFIVVELKRV